ncbi:hypothetical protein ACP70R_031573 [Stipagrostis hirtigluma subsp. patula]
MNMEEPNTRQRSRANTPRSSPTHAVPDATEGVTETTQAHASGDGGQADIASAIIMQLIAPETSRPTANTPRSSPAHAVPDASQGVTETTQAHASGVGGQADGASAIIMQVLRPIDFRKHSELMNVDKQLAQYFKKAVTINWALILALFSTTSCRDEKEQQYRRRLFGVSCAASLTLNWIPQLLAGWMAKRAATHDNTDNERVNAWDSRRIFLLCIVTYGCNISLAITAVFLEMLLRGDYAWFFFLLLMPVACYCYVLCDSRHSGISWAVAQYEEHRADLDFFFGLCFEITQTNFAALSASLFGYMQRTQCKGVHFRAPEIILLVAVVIGLQLMALCTAPPAAGIPKLRKWFITVLMKHTTYGLLLLSVLGLGAAVTIMCDLYTLIPGILGLFYYLSVFEFTGNGIVVKVRAMMRRPGGAQPNLATNTTSEINLIEQPGSAAVVEHILQSSVNAATSSTSQSAEPQGINVQEEAGRAAGEHTLLLVNIYSVLSGGLMLTYSLGIGTQYKAPVICMYMAIIGYLIQVVAVRELTARKTVVLVCRVIAALLLFGAIICVVVFFLYRPLPSSSTSKSEGNEPPRG